MVGQGRGRLGQGGGEGRGPGLSLCNQCQLEEKHNNPWLRQKQYERKEGGRREGGGREEGKYENKQIEVSAERAPCAWPELLVWPGEE